MYSKYKKQKYKHKTSEQIPNKLTLTSLAALSIYSRAVCTDPLRFPISSIPSSRSSAASTQLFNFCFCYLLFVILFYFAED